MVFEEGEEIDSENTWGKRIPEGLTWALRERLVVMGIEQRKWEGKEGINWGQVIDRLLDHCKDVDVY